MALLTSWEGSSGSIGGHIDRLAGLQRGLIGLTRKSAERRWLVLCAPLVRLGWNSARGSSEAARPLEGMPSTSPLSWSQGLLQTLVLASMVSLGFVHDRGPQGGPPAELATRDPAASEEELGAPGDHVQGRATNDAAPCIRKKALGDLLFAPGTPRKALPMPTMLR